MQLENIQIQLTKNITEHHTAWSHLLANTNFGNYASNFWNVTLKPKYISVDLSNNTFTFHNANFEFDVEVGLSFGDDNSLYSKQISGQPFSLKH